MCIISFSGKARSGKDTLANVLCEKFGYQNISFAESLKNMCSHASGLERSYFFADELKDKTFDTPLALNDQFVQDLIKNFRNITDEQKLSIESSCANKTVVTPREMLQYVGTEVIRKSMGDNVWIDLVRNQLHYMNNNYGQNNFVITDCRFPNERKMLRELGSILFYLERPSFQIYLERPSFQIDSNHASETSLGGSSEYDFTIFNTGTRGAFILKFLDKYSKLF